MKIGIPLQILLLFATVLFLSNDKWLINWIVAIAILVTTVAFRLSAFTQFLTAARKEKDDEEDRPVSE
jgi:uncharacterized membrane protein